MPVASLFALVHRRRRIAQRHVDLMRTIVAIFALCLVSSCSRPAPGPRAEDLQPLLGKTVREVVVSLRMPESSLQAGDEPPGRFRMVSGYLPDEPLGRRLTIYVSREAGVISQDRKVVAADLFDKIASGIAVSFPDGRPDVVVGDVVAYYHLQP